MERAYNVQLLDINKVRILREQRGWSQRQLAREANVDISVIARIEKGQQKDFKLSAIAAVAKVLDVSIDTLLVQPHSTQTPDLAPELSAVLLIAARQPQYVHQQIAGMIRGYLDVLSKQ